MFNKLRKLSIPGYEREYESKGPSLAASSTSKTLETPRSMSSHCRFSRLLSAPVAIGGEPIASKLFGTCFGMADSSNWPLSAFQLISGSTIESPMGRCDLLPNITPAFLEKKRRRKVVIAPVSIEVVSRLGVGGFQAESVGLSGISSWSADLFAQSWHLQKRVVCQQLTFLVNPASGDIPDSSTPKGTSPGPFGPHGIQTSKATSREVPKPQILCFESLSTGRRSPIPSQSSSLASRDPLHQHNVVSQDPFEERMGDPTPKDPIRFGDALVGALQSFLNHSAQVSPEKESSYWSASESESECDE